MTSLLGKLVGSLKQRGLGATLHRVYRYPLRRFSEQQRLAVIDEVRRERNIQSKFTRIFETNYWADEESRSGGGSSLAYTESVRRGLPLLLRQLNVRVLLDAPCGDFNWMPLVLKDTHLDYIGADIVEPLIQRNIKVHGGPARRFIHLDLTSDPYPHADLLMCRDCLFHLSYSDTLRMLERFVSSGIPYLLTSTHRQTEPFRNRDIATGDFRLIDLFSAPYRLPKDVVARIDDSCEGWPAREMCVWTREQVLFALPAFSRALTQVPAGHGGPDDAGE